MISPILKYNSEIWSGYAKPDFKTWDGSQVEKTHLHLQTVLSINRGKQESF